MDNDTTGEPLPVLIIGSGFGGLAAAVQLDRRGIGFQILERRSFMGGTWMQNTYPGAAVDVQSPLYSLSFEPYDWSRLFAERDEIAAYTEHIITKYGLASRTRLQANVEALEWKEGEDVWAVTLTGGEVLRARFVINASGPLSTPAIPDFPGRSDFQGPAFHTNHWDHSVDLRGKRVAVIGSGASAAQVIPAIVDDVAELHVFQRTPHWVGPRRDRVFSTFERALLRNRIAYRALRSAIYWALEGRVIGFKYSETMLKLVERLDVRAHLHRQVADPELRAKLTPSYRLGCKRVILSNELYPALCREHTTLRGREQGIERITATGIRTIEGEEIELDAIVYATGFDATDGAIAYPIGGLNGNTLKKAWADYPRAYLGTALPDFPNLFFITGPNTGIGHTSALFIIEAQLRYILDSIRTVRRRGARCIEVRRQAEEDYTHRIHQEMERTVWHTGGCTSWYQSRSGKVIAMFPGFSFTYRWLTRRICEDHHEIRGGWA